MLMQLKLTQIVILVLIVHSLSSFTKPGLLSFSGNLGMTIYLQQVMSPTPKLSALESSAQYLEKHLAIVSQRLVTGARYLGILRSIDSYRYNFSTIEAKVSKILKIFPCASEEYALLATVAQPLIISDGPQFSPLFPLDFHVNTDAVGQIFFKKLHPPSESCGATITVNYDLHPQRYVVLRSTVRVVPNKIYLLKAQILTQGIETAWLGIASQWTGQPISQQNQWREVTFAFKTKPDQFNETIQLVIETGHGTLQITNVGLRQVQ